MRAQIATGTLLIAILATGLSHTEYATLPLPRDLLPFGAGPGKRVLMADSPRASP